MVCWFDVPWQERASAASRSLSFSCSPVRAALSTESRVLYDNGFIYVGTTCTMTRPGLSKPDHGRDEQLRDLDYFSVLSTHSDHQNGYQFLVTSSNVYKPMPGSSPNLTVGPGDYGDKTWDAVGQQSAVSFPMAGPPNCGYPILSLPLPGGKFRTGVSSFSTIRHNNEISFWNRLTRPSSGVNSSGLQRRSKDEILRFASVLTLAIHWLPSPALTNTYRMNG